MDEEVDKVFAGVFVFYKSRGCIHVSTGTNMAVNATNGLA